MHRRNVTIAVYAAALFSWPWAVAALPEYWREGPVMIEAQKMPLTFVPGNSVILTIDSDGVIWRGGRKIEDLDREELMEVIFDLVAYEIAQSRPPERKFRR